MSKALWHMTHCMSHKNKRLLFSNWIDNTFVVNEHIYFIMHIEKNVTMLSFVPDVFLWITKWVTTILLELYQEKLVSFYLYWRILRIADVNIYIFLFMKIVGKIRIVVIFFITWGLTKVMKDLKRLCAQKHSNETE